MNQLSAAGRHQLDAMIERCSFPLVTGTTGGAVVCAVSGGADSTALLALARHSGREVLAVHVDHGLRPQSGAEGEIVRANAERLGAAFRAERVDVGDGPGLEARARTARYGVLPRDVCTGHTADDQAETVLLHLLRGSGTRGLAGMRAGPPKPAGGERSPCRPILALRRSETEAVCRLLNLVVVDDPSNRDPRFTRNRVRSEMLPLLREIGGRDPVPILVRQAELLREDDDLLDVLAASVDPANAPALAAAPLALARRAVRRWVMERDPRHHPPDAAAVQRILDVADGLAVACEVPGSGRVERHAQRLTIRFDQRDASTPPSAE